MHSQSVADRNADPASCQKYVEQFDVYASRHTNTGRRWRRPCMRRWRVH